MALSPDLLDKLACPKCRGELALIADGAALACRACALRYEIEDDIPNLLIDEAKPLQAPGQAGPS
jgi:hypothetical protein